MAGDPSTENSAVLRSSNVVRHVEGAFNDGVSVDGLSARKGPLGFGSLI